MSQDRTGGSLLTQQTVLGFSGHPPSPFGAGHLPQFVTEQRGGQDNFAMNRHTQLQFNLGMPPSPTNLATYFDPFYPRPVVIEKQAAGGDEGFKVVSAKKLALAVRMAKRDIKLGRCQPTFPKLCHTCRNEEASHEHHCPTCRIEQAIPQHTNMNEDDASVWSTVHCSRGGPGILVPQTQSHNASRAELEQREASMQQPSHHRTNLSHLQDQSLPLDEHLLVGREGNKRENDRSSKEVMRLRKELHKQVTYMKQLHELGRGNVMLARRDAVGKRGRGKLRSGAGRVWMEEVKGEEEKLLERKEEQSVRNARTIYNLSLQVSSLQRDIQKLQLTDTTSSNNKKSQATRRLAAIYRSSLRLLQNYHAAGHTPEPLPPELVLLLQQLSLLAHHFGVGGANYELEATMKTLQELIEEQEKENAAVARQQLKVSTASQRPAMKKKVNQVKSTKKTSVLLHPQPRSRSTRRGRGRVGQPHFAQQTMSSQQRQQPPQQRYLWQQYPRQPTYSPIKQSPAMLHSSTPLVLQRETERDKVLHHLAKKHRQETQLNQDDTTPPSNTPLLHPRDDNVSANVRAASTAESTRSCSSPAVVKRIHIANLREEEDEERVSSSSPRSQGDEQRLWMESITAYLSHHSRQLEKFKTSTEKQLSQLQQKLSSKVKLKMKTEEAASLPESVGESSESEKKKDSPHDKKKFEELVERLRELEGEEEVIRGRWRTIAYEDPPLAKPQIVYSSEKKLSRESVASPPPEISDEAQQRINTYKQRFEHHLQMTGHNTKGGFNPWKMAENLADDLLLEVVDQLADELGGLCDGYVDRLFSSEFAPPTTTPP